MYRAQNGSVSTSSTSPSSPVAKEDTARIRKSYLLDGGSLETINKMYTAVESNHDWEDTFYDTPGHDLSGAECILMRDSDSAKYWKFFCYAHNNIMEITTDESDLKEPLSRLINYCPTWISENLLKPFFRIRNAHRTLHSSAGGHNGAESKLAATLHVYTTDYGFGHCVIEMRRVPHAQLLHALDHIHNTAKVCGLKDLAAYDCREFL